MGVQRDYLHYIFNDQGEYDLGDQHFDWVVVPSNGDKFQAPVEMKYQFLPMKNPAQGQETLPTESAQDFFSLRGCFNSELEKTEYTDDLTDHYAVFAQICYSSNCPTLPQLKSIGTNPLPSGPNCAKKQPGLCSEDKECSHSECGRPEADMGDKEYLVCCPEGCSASMYAFYYYCYCIESGKSCFSDAMCKTNDCSGGICSYKKPAGEECKDPNDCMSNDCRNGQCAGKCYVDGCGGATTPWAHGSDCKWGNARSWIGAPSPGKQLTRSHEPAGCTYCNGDRCVFKKPIGAKCGNDNDCMTDDCGNDNRCK